MDVREGLIPTVLGAAVTATGAIMKRRDIAPMIAAGIVGFGLAHVVLGTIDMVQHMDDRRTLM
ncbi:asparagine synthase [Thermotalea metallivorans]|uniref:Asparagine synthase n=1 Tax=Thermotalea metallivorans TaxID=520762 RepID=A0A140L6D9_9FIRM|nr:asparagine synthase [Thermotalea metallivorans]KXG76114.1 hypothetical protein AN619_10710 [Thermotalea metallivorans]